MSKLNKHFHKKPQVSYDIQVEKGLNVLKNLESKVNSWCTYDCYYYDCGIPCPENNQCHIELVKLCNKLESLTHKDEKGEIEDYINEYKNNILFSS